MKRIGNLYEKIISVENLMLADKNARRGKLKSYGVKTHDLNRNDNILKLHDLLKNGEYKTSKYYIFKIYEPKERDIYRLPYYPDRIVHHAVMNIFEEIWVNIFTADTYSCIKNRGIHGAMKNVKKALQNETETRYCLKLDIKKYYPNIDHDILKNILLKKIKCKRTILLLNEIIDSADGIPIGNYLSQYFANLYLTYFDHWIKEILKIKYYFRYADDIVILNENKENLRIILNKIDYYFKNELNLQIKSNYQIFPVSDRGVDFVGFVFFHTHTRMRKTIKINFKRKLKKINNEININESIYKKEICGWIGWAKYSDSKNFLKKNIKKDFVKLFINEKV